MFLFIVMRHRLIVHSFSAKDYRKVDKQKPKNPNSFHIMLCLKVAQPKMIYYSILESSDSLKWQLKDSVVLHFVTVKQVSLFISN